MMFNRIPLSCMLCGKELSGNLDTYGDVRHEMCWDCHSSFIEEAYQRRQKIEMSQKNSFARYLLVTEDE